METESDGHLRFLDLDIYRRPNGTLGHKTYRKPTDVILNFNAKSHHHPFKQALLWHIQPEFFVMKKACGS
jgi:hypothetical protein